MTDQDGVIIVVNDNGAYVVRGGAKLVDREGKEFDTPVNFLLCRCGHSKTKPFCDSSHKEVGFESRERASDARG